MKKVLVVVLFFVCVFFKNVKAQETFKDFLKMIITDSYTQGYISSSKEVCSNVKLLVIYQYKDILREHVFDVSEIAYDSCMTGVLDKMMYGDSKHLNNLLKIVDNQMSKKRGGKGDKNK